MSSPPRRLDADVLDDRVELRRGRAAGPQLGAVGGDADLVGACGARVAQGVDAVAAVDVEQRRAGHRDVHGDGVGAFAGPDVDLVVGLAAGHLHRGGRAGHGLGCALVAELDAVVLRRAADDDGVGHGVAGAVEAVQVDREGLELGAGGVARHQRVAAGESVDLDALDAAEVRDHVRDVAEETHARAVGGDVDRLGGGAAVEVQDVGARLALDDVVVVAGVPGEAVVAGAEPNGVVAVAAGDGVVAAAADQGLVAEVAGQGVVAAAAVDGRDLVEELAAVGDAIVAAAGLDVDRRERAAVEAEVAGAVAIDVDLEDVRVAGLELERDVVGAVRAADEQRAVLHLGRGRGGRLGDREAERGRGEHARSERARPSGCVHGGSFRGEERRCCPPSARERNARVFTHRPEVLLALG